MQGSYILLFALGIFFLIGGAKRVLRSIRLSSFSAVLFIVLIIIGNLFPPVGKDIRFYLGTLILTVLSILFLATDNYKAMSGMIASVIVIAVLISLYKTQIIDRFKVTEFASSIMIIAGTAISSFILTKNSGQAFTVSILSLIGYAFAVALIGKKPIVIGDPAMFEIIIYSSLGAVFLNELVLEFIPMFSERAYDLRFEAGRIDESEDNSEGK